MLLVVTNKSDLSSDYLIQRIKKRSVPFIRLNTEDFGVGFKIDICLSNLSKSFVISFSDGRMIKREDISAVYFHHPISPKLAAGLDDDDLMFAERETVETLRSVWRLIPNELWLNHPKHIWIGSNKVDQLAVAIDQGFKVPDTLISSEKNSVESFIGLTDSNIIAKAVKHGFVTKEKEMWVASTRRLPKAYMSDYDSYFEIPITYQHEVQKTYDIRVVVVGSKVFATAIHSQGQKETEVDWRVGDILDINLPHESIELPKNIEQKCCKIVKHYSLKYSSIDLVYSDNKEYYFLELNPNGQWAWIEQLTGKPIRDTIIDTLVENTHEPQ